jgi:murein DD-endopeptidase MepM/ murein hydrolase activator NlpD
MSILEATPYSGSNNPFRIYESTAPSPFAPTIRSATHAYSKRVARPWWQQHQREGFIATLVAVVIVFIAILPRPLLTVPLVSVLSPLHIPAIPVAQQEKTVIKTITPAQTRSLFRSLKEIHVSSPFGSRWGRRHQGIDFSAPAGTPIYAVSPGKIVYSGWESGYGKTVLIEHRPGFRTRYAHCRQLLASTGQWVRSGKLIARVGSTGHSTGPHLHFEVIVDGVHRNPLRYYRLTARASDLQANVPVSLQGKWVRSVEDLMKLWHQS